MTITNLPTTTGPNLVSSLRHYSYAQFKNDVQTALEDKFGTDGVTRGDKAFDVHANTYRVDADVVPAFAYRLYKKKEYNFLLNAQIMSYVEPEGTRFISDTNKTSRTGRSSTIRMESPRTIGRETASSSSCVPSNG